MEKGVCGATGAPEGGDAGAGADHDDGGRGGRQRDVPGTQEDRQGRPWGVRDIHGANVEGALRCLPC